MNEFFLLLLKEEVEVEREGREPLCAMASIVLLFLMPSIAFLLSLLSSTAHSLVSMISPCDATSSSVLGLYFSTQGADAAVAAARARASADDAAAALAAAGALPLASAFAAAAAAEAAAAAAAAASAVDAGASTMSASVIWRGGGAQQGKRRRMREKERGASLETKKN